MNLDYRAVTREGQSHLGFAVVSPTVIAWRSDREGKADWGALYIGTAEQIKALEAYFSEADAAPRALAFACRPEADFRLVTVADVLRVLHAAKDKPYSEDVLAVILASLDEVRSRYSVLSSVNTIGKDAVLNF